MYSALPLFRIFLFFSGLELCHPNTPFPDFKRIMIGKIQALITKLIPSPPEDLDFTVYHVFSVSRGASVLESFFASIDAANMVREQYFLQSRDQRPDFLNNIHITNSLTMGSHVCVALMKLLKEK